TFVIGRAPSIESRDRQQAARAQRQRVLHAVGVGDDAPARGVAVVHGGDAIERLPRLHAVHAVRAGRTRRRVLRSERHLLVVLGEQEVEPRPQRHSLRREVDERELHGGDHGLERVQVAPVESHPRRPHVVTLLVAARQRRIHLHQLHDLAGVLRDRLPLRRGVEEQTHCHLPRLRARVAQRRHTPSGHCIRRPTVHAVHRELVGIEQAGQLVVAAFDLEERLLRHQNTPGWGRRPRRSSSSTTRCSMASMIRSTSSFCDGAVEPPTFGGANDGAGSIIDDSSDWNRVDSKLSVSSDSENRRSTLVVESGASAAPPKAGTTDSVGAGVDGAASCTEVAAVASGLPALPPLPPSPDVTVDVDDAVDGGAGRRRRTSGSVDGVRRIVVDTAPPAARAPLVPSAVSRPVPAPTGMCATLGAAVVPAPAARPTRSIVAGATSVGAATARSSRPVERASASSSEWWSSSKNRGTGDGRAACTSSWATISGAGGRVAGAAARWMTLSTVAACLPTAASARVVAGPDRTPTGRSPATARTNGEYCRGSGATGSTGWRRSSVRKRAPVAVTPGGIAIVPPAASPVAAVRASLTWRASVATDGVPGTVVGVPLIAVSPVVASAVVVSP